jgi:hypothetical protein
MIFQRDLSCRSWNGLKCCWIWMIGFASFILILNAPTPFVYQSSIIFFFTNSQNHLSTGILDCSNDNESMSSNALSDLIPLDQLEFCEEHNFVLPSSYTDQLISSNSNTTKRTYSIHRQSFQRHHNRYCSLSTELLQAIELGRRSQEEGVGSSKINKTVMMIHPSENTSSSYFIPKECDIPYLISREYCTAANAFDHILLMGNIHVRRLHQAMIMIYRNDFIVGSIEPSPTNSSEEELFRCYCDAQFSPSERCTLPSYGGLLPKFQPYQLHSCPELPFDRQFQQILIPPTLDASSHELDLINCTIPDYKGLLLYLQGGEKESESGIAQWESLFHSIISSPTVIECSKVKKLTVILSGRMTSRLSLDLVDSNEELNSEIQFDMKMDNLLRQAGIAASSIRWTNLTDGAFQSEGMHFLSDVHYARAQHTMILATMLQREQQNSNA